LGENNNMKGEREGREKEEEKKERELGEGMLLF
jgi:hypothetical protein